MEGKNLLFIFSDEHSRDITGCYGNELVQTPNLDRLAARGTRFANPYTNCPICVPARASLGTGRHVHKIGAWDNAHPYDGTVKGWGHELIDAGHEVASIGKLHYRSGGDPTGWSEEVETLHVVDGIGDLLGMLRDPLPERGNIDKLALEAGRGESSYTQYDRRIAAHARRWLEQRAARPPAKPWALYVGFVLPHFPLVAPEEFFDLYAGREMPWPHHRAAGEQLQHPVLNGLRRCINYDDYFNDERVQTALRAYYGMVSFLDHHIGLLVQTLEQTGLIDDTRIVYSSDHGDNLGNRGLWGKSVMYDDSTAVPLIMAGPGIDAGKVVTTPVSLVDMAPTIIQGLGETPSHDDYAGRSLFEIAAGAEPDRAVFSEYHAVGALSGMFMIRKGRWKYVHYEGYAPQLFDLDADPLEAADLGQCPEHAEIRVELDAELRSICDPTAVNAQAFADQARLVAEHGGPEAIMARGDFGYTPAPGQNPDFS